MEDNIRKNVLEIACAAIDSVRGENLVANALAETDFDGPIEVAAVGKAAAAMVAGAHSRLNGLIKRTLVITKTGHLLPDISHLNALEVIESGHPVPTEASLQAGERLISWIEEAGSDSTLLFLISGGASSLAEAPVPGITLDDLQAINRWLLASGLPIDAINSVRRKVSRIKGGNLLGYVGGRCACVWLISDVPGDNPAVIGSGPLYPPTGEGLAVAGYPDWLTVMLDKLTPQTVPQAAVPEHRVLGNLQTACEAALAQAQSMGFEVTLHREELDRDAEQTGKALISNLEHLPAGIHIWGGETTVTLPDNPGRGGRNQQLALAAAMALAGRDDIVLLSIGTDGTDGPTEDAGAMVDGQTLARGEAEGFDARASLKRADAGRFLEASGDLIATGPTGTNVRDIVIAWKRA